MMKRTIKLGIVIGDDIRTRSRIHEIKKYLIIPGDYILDFSEVCFISRSFADELISFIDSYRYNIECANVPPEIDQLLTIVRNNRSIPHIATPHNDVLQLENMDQMVEFFETI